MGASYPTTAQRCQAEEDGQRQETDRVRDDALRDDDGRHSFASLQAAFRHGRRTDSSACQERRPRRHPRVHTLATSTQKGHTFNHFEFLVGRVGFGCHVAVTSSNRRGRHASASSCSYSSFTASCRSVTS